MKKTYIEELPAIPERDIKHDIIICDYCETVIVDNGKKLEEHFQSGDGKKLLDFCSERCMKKVTKKLKD